MADRSFVAARSKQAIGRAFPDSPTLLPAPMCDGLAFVGQTSPDLFRLRGLRDHVIGLWHGALGDRADLDLLIVAFDRPVPVDTAAWPAALPLAASAAGMLVSYVDLPRPSLRGVAAAPGTVPRQIDLWWGGQPYRITIDTLVPIPIALLWDAPMVIVHRSTVVVAQVADNGPGSARDGTARVSRARVPAVAEGAEPFGETEAALRALEERTRLGAIFKQALGKLFGGRSLGESEGGGGKAGAGSGEAPPREPGVLENLAGWVRWHTPLGKGLIERFGDRMKLVEKLLSSGDVDSALKLALKLGNADGAEGKRTLFPTRLPDMRATLDFNIGFGGALMPILGDASFHSLRTRYAELAKSLERGGDYRRAAYIHAQLLSDHRAAVLTLEKGELYTEAARLAFDAKLEPALYIRLFYKAGAHDTALALARRSGCFGQLAEESRVANPEFHAYVVRAWTDMLIATGQPLRALQITDSMAVLAEPDPQLIAMRASWLRTALEAYGRDDVPIEAIVRCLLTASWTVADIAPDGLDDFPVMAPVQGSGPFPAQLERIQALIRHEGENPRQEMIAFLSTMVRMSNREALEQAAFWRGPAQIIIEVFARSLLESASAGLSQSDQQALTTLLKAADLHVFATDLGKLRKLHVAPVVPQENWKLPPPATRSSAIRQACLLHNGTMMIWRENSLLQLLDRHGRALWQGSVGDVTALVAIGSSPNVMIVQQQGGASLLTRFASHRRSFQTIGLVDLAAHHDVTSEGQWLVQIGGEIGALDLVKLCADAPEIEFLWSCALTGKVRALAFLHDSAAPRWLTCNLQPGRVGVLEMWTLSQTRQLETRIGQPNSPAKEGGDMQPGDWFWTQTYVHRLTDTHAPHVTMPFVAWTDSAEREIARKMELRQGAPRAFDTVQSCDFGRAYVSLGLAGPDAEGVAMKTAIVPAGPKPVSMIVEHEADMPLACLARGARIGDGSDRSNIVLLADPHGRLLQVDVAARHVTLF